MLHASRLGTVRACLACRHPVTPAAVLAPYERGDAGAVRVVKSQAERDLEAIALAQRKGLMLDQLGKLADDDRLDPASLPVIDWFRDQVKDTSASTRLDELAALLPQAGIRRRHRWQGKPTVAIEAAYDDEDGAAWDDADEDDEDDYPRAIEAAPPPAPAVDYAAELARREYEWRPHGAGLCQLVHLKPHGWDWVPPEECLGRAAHVIPGGAVCEGCYYALTPAARGPLGGAQ